MTSFQIYHDETIVGQDKAVSWYHAVDGTPMVMIRVYSYSERKNVIIPFPASEFDQIMTWYRDARQRISTPAELTRGI